jgi:hypothetical protein
VRAEPAGEVLDRRHAVVAALGDDVGRPVLEGELLAWRVAAHRDDPFRAELFRGQHREQADGTVADDRDRPTGTGLASAVMAMELDAGIDRSDAVRPSVGYR